jgi:hypothetical protein
MISRRLALRSAVACGAAAALHAPHLRPAGAQVAPGSSVGEQSPPVPSFSEQARRRMMPGDPAERGRAAAERQALLDEAEARLATGRATEALQTFERAASMQHAADAELGIVRAHMGAGHYSRAAAFCAHTAGAHRETTGGSALYAWLLHLAGQTTVARRVLGEGIERAPADPLLHEVEAALASTWPLAGATMRRRPWHAAPFASGAALVAARVAGSATLLPSGVDALLPLSVADVTRAAPLAVRDGLGRTVPVLAVHLVDRGPAAPDMSQLPIARLVLGPGLGPPGWWPSAREPFAGSPGTMIEFAPDEGGAAAWPLARIGFFAGVPGRMGEQGARPLGLPAPPGPRGGPVFDRAGHLAGLAASAADGSARFVPWQAWTGGPALPSASSQRPDGATRDGSTFDAVYERGLRTALQVLVAH